MKSIYHCLAPFCFHTILSDRTTPVFLSTHLLYNALGRLRRGSLCHGSAVSIQRVIDKGYKKIGTWTKGGSAVKCVSKAPPSYSKGGGRLAPQAQPIKMSDAEGAVVISMVSFSLNLWSFLVVARVVVVSEVNVFV